MASNIRLTRGLLLAFTALSLQAGTVQALSPSIARPQVGQGVVVTVQSDVDAARRRLKAAQQALQAAKAAGGDVAAAQAEVKAARAALQAATAGAQQQEQQQRSKRQPAEEQKPNQQQRQKEQQQKQLEQRQQQKRQQEEQRQQQEQQQRPKRQPAEEQKPNQQQRQQELQRKQQEQLLQKKRQQEELRQQQEQQQQRPKRQPADEQRPNQQQEQGQPAGKPRKPVDAPETQRPRPADGTDQKLENGKPKAGQAREPQVLPGDENRPRTDANGKPRPDANVDGEVRRPKRTDTAEERARKKKNAENPAATNDTVVLPVDGGAPVLDSEKRLEKRLTPAQEEKRRQQRRDVERRPPPKSDAEAQRPRREDGKPRPPVRADRDEGRRLDERPRYERRYEQDVERRVDNRLIIEFGDTIVVRGDDNRRFERYGRPPVYEQLPNGRVREIVFKENGDQIVSIRNRYGELIQRSRIDRRGREYVLFFSPDLYYADDSYRRVYRDPALDLPPMVLQIPVRDYIIDTSSDPDRNYYEFIEQPPVEAVERVYTLDEVRNSARIRDKMRRIDLDTITFATGSADISMNQASSLKKVADAISQALEEDPAETFLIEGHTDAVGSAESNLVLSDLRAEAVANVLTEVYGIAPENMVTQGYGEEFLKVDTDGPEQLNRRVTIRRVTPLVRPVEAAEIQQ